MKIGVVNVDEAISCSNAAELLKQERATKEQELDALIEEYESMGGTAKLNPVVLHPQEWISRPGRRPIRDYSNFFAYVKDKKYYGLTVKVNSGKFSNDKEKNEYIELLRKSRNIVRSADRIEADYEESLEALEDKAEEAIDQLVREGGYDLILRHNDKIVLAFSQQVDATDDLAKLLDDMFADS